MDSLKNCFIPILQIYPSEFRRQIFLDEFVKYAYTEVPQPEDTPTYALAFKINLDVIFRSYMYELDETDARTIASFISYLGTNGGRCLLGTFEKYAESQFFRDKETAFVHAWVSENSRQFGTNNNLRAIEYILTPIENHDLQYGLKNFSLNNIKSTHYEVIECIVKWLSTPDGVAYIVNCLDLIDQAKDTTYEIKKLARKPEG